MTVRDRDQDRDDPLCARLRALPSARLDDVTSSRTLACAEAVLLETGARAVTTRAPAPSSSRISGWLLATALVGWGMLYVWGAVGALARLFPMGPPPAAVTFTAPRPLPGRAPVTVAAAGAFR
jgi:hypothetical protein